MAEIDLAAQYGRMADAADAGNYDEYDKRGRQLSEDQAHEAREHYRREEEREAQDFKTYEAKLEAEAADRLVLELEEIIEMAQTALVPHQPDWEIIKKQLDEFSIPYSEVTEEELTRQPITETMLHKWKRRADRRYERKLRAAQGEPQGKTTNLLSDSEDNQPTQTTARAAKRSEDDNGGHPQTTGGDGTGNCSYPPLIDLRESPPTTGEQAHDTPERLPGTQGSENHNTSSITPTAPFVPIPLPACADNIPTGDSKAEAALPDQVEEALRTTPGRDAHNNTSATTQSHPHDAALAAMVPLFDDFIDDDLAAPTPVGDDKSGGKVEYHYIGDDEVPLAQTPTRGAKTETSTSPDTKRLAQASEDGDVGKPVPVPSASSIERKARADNPSPRQGQEAATAAEQGN